MHRPSAQVGGHCDTWTEPTTGQRIDTGVLVYPDQPLITDTFQRFNVTLLRFNILGTTTDGPANPTIDFSGNGSDVYLGPEPSPSPAAFLAAYALWTRLFTERWSFTETTARHPLAAVRHAPHASAPFRRPVERTGG